MKILCGAILSAIYANLETYAKGVARFGGLYCDYDFNAEDFLHSLKFGGYDGYKLDGSVVYEKPKSSGDAIVIPYHRWHWEGDSAAEGEFRLKWDAASQWFSVEQVVY